LASASHDLLGLVLDLTNNPDYLTSATADKILSGRLCVTIDRDKKKWCNLVCSCVTSQDYKKCLETCGIYQKLEPYLDNALMCAGPDTCYRQELSYRKQIARKLCAHNTASTVTPWP